MTDSGETSEALNTQKMCNAEGTHGIDIDEVFKFLELCASRSQYSPPLVYRSEYDIGLIPGASPDLRKQALSFNQFKKSAKRGKTLLASIEERLQEASSKSDTPKYDGAWEDIHNDMSEASNEVFVANRIYEKLKDNGSNCISDLSSIRTEVNEKWFSVRKLFQDCEEKMAHSDYSSNNF